MLLDSNLDYFKILLFHLFKKNSDVASTSLSSLASNDDRRFENENKFSKYARYSSSSLNSFDNSYVERHRGAYKQKLRNTQEVFNLKIKQLRDKKENILKKLNGIFKLF